MSAFRFGFLRAFAENGIDIEDFEKHIEKKSDTILTGSALSGAKAITNISLLPIGLALAAGIGTGYLGARGYDRMVGDPEPVDIDDLKNEELTKELRIRAQRLARKKMIRESKLH